ncbi:uncharacterized protein APUU_81047S [Aspergillus puulaauensis]|uniref:Uncharacterized protein n=1 Tax=Aspergillus puulaauensis TaxID=1220207 RepID=A0A7R8ASS8_9EURO|nr:uncharacterized protein APUU_81047S [Aspergillus puulaauensis]BCS30744.1 hypothetical protein APUU_81047S [Aspergillus puulaauensis]
MGKEDIMVKVRSLLHPSAKESTSSDSITTASLMEKSPKVPQQTRGVGHGPYNGDQCFGSCCRGSTSIVYQTYQPSDQCFGSCCRGRAPVVYTKYQPGDQCFGSCCRGSGYER